MVALSRVEHLGRFGIVRGLGLGCRFICATWRVGRNRKCAAQGSTPLTLEPVEPCRDGTELAMAFYISMGVRRGDNALLQQLDDSLEKNHAAISAILADYHVPILPDAFAPP